MIGRNNAIAANNTLMLSTSKTYTATQNFSNIVVLGNFNSLSFGNLTNGSMTAAPVATQCVAVGCSSSANGYSSTAIGFQANANAQYCVSLGYNALSSGNNTISIGSGAGTNSITTQINDLFLGAYTSINSGGGYSNSTCIGYGANIYASNQIMMGTTSETVVCPGKLTLATNYSLLYTTLPVFISSQIGFTSNANKANTFVVSYDAFLNINSISLMAGVYIINFALQLTTNTATFPGPIEKGWLAVGLSSSINDLSFINKRMAFLTTNTTSFYIAESFFSLLIQR